jgi:hypothetical protein
MCENSDWVSKILTYHWKDANKEKSFCQSSKICNSIIYLKWKRKCNGSEQSE